MTGVVETVGLGLAVIPIVISVADHYSAAARALKRYRQFSSEIRRLSMFMNVQRTKFHCEIQSLLSQCVGWERAELLLEDTDNEQWKDKGLEEAFATKLGTSRASFMRLIEDINAELCEMEARLRPFEEVTQLAKKVCALPFVCRRFEANYLLQGDEQDDTHWRRHIKEKIRFVFSKSQLQDSMITLKELLEYLGALRSQSEISEQRRPLSRTSAQAQQAIEQFALVQTASQNLYDALRSACTKHTQHQARFSLQPMPTCKAHQVRFSVDFRQVVAPASVSKQTAWFTVESIVKQSVKPCSSEPDSKALATLNQSVKRQRASYPPAPQKQPCKLQKKSIRFQLPCSPSSSLSPLPLSLVKSREPSVDPPLSNLCSRNNFCNQLQNFLSRSVAQPECCIGYLEKSSDSKHLIYLKGQEAKSEEDFNGPPSSLDELLLYHQKGFDETSGTPQSERLCLSKKLAAAVLHFYSTPWLRNSWSSSDVLFQIHSASNKSQIDSLKEPFVDVSVGDSNFVQNAGHPPTCYPFAPNDFLFGLGVMLLELAFQQPLRYMRQPCDVANSEDERHILFFTAKRMSRLVSTKSGTRYGEIVRKCLACDFGRGDDLSKPALQEGVYREVICELTELEELLRKMDLGP
jgi:hypothetical protein